jgi:hypothetical protein
VRIVSIRYILYPVCSVSTVLETNGDIHTHTIVSFGAQHASLSAPDLLAPHAFNVTARKYCGLDSSSGSCTYIHTERGRERERESALSNNKNIQRGREKEPLSNNKNIQRGREKEPLSNNKNIQREREREPLSNNKNIHRERERESASVK